MGDQEKQTQQEAERAEKRVAAEAVDLVKEQARKKAYLAREEAIDKTSKATAAGRAEKRASDDSKGRAREKAGRDDYFANEKKIAEGQEARKLKDDSQSKG